MRESVNEIMGMFEEAESAGLIKIEDSAKLETWVHDERGYLYVEEMPENSR